MSENKKFFPMRKEFSINYVKTIICLLRNLVRDRYVQSLL
jgi:hypothetical protein